MSDQLERRIRSHMYAPNPAITDYLSGQRNSSSIVQVLEELVTVRERRPSGVSQMSESPALDWTDGTDEQVVTDQHNRCITPCDEYINKSNCICCMCQTVAINPFRCTRLDERNGNGVVIDYNGAYERPHHICCYQCLTKNMLKLRSGRFDCPVCRVNEFNFNRLIGANNETIREGEKYLICCPNNCGVMGPPLALAHHICPLADYEQVGHTSMSNIVVLSTRENSRLNCEMNQMRAEMNEVLSNYNRRKEYSLKWEGKYRELLDGYVSQVNQLNQMAYQLNMSEQINGQLINIVQMKDREIQSLNENKDETIHKCKSKLKLVAKHYKTKVQELSDEKDRALAELSDLLRNTCMGGQRHTLAASDWPHLDSGDEHTVSFANIFRTDNSGQQTTSSGSQTDGSSDGQTRVEID